MKAFFLDLLLDLYENFKEIFLGIVVMLLVMIGGFLISLLLRKLIERILVFFKFDKWAKETGITDFLLKGGVFSSPSVIVGKIIFWISIIAFFSFSLNFIGISQFSEYASRISNFLPHILIAIVIFVLGIIFSNFLSRVIFMTLENAGLRYSESISKGVKALLVIIISGIILEYLGIGSTIITIGLLILFGGIILSLSLAVGIGFSHIVSEFIREHLKERAEKKETSRKKEPPEPL